MRRSNCSKLIVKMWIDAITHNSTHRYLFLCAKHHTGHWLRIQRSCSLFTHNILGMQVHQELTRENMLNLRHYLLCGFHEDRRGVCVVIEFPAILILPWTQIHTIYIHILNTYTTCITQHTHGHALPSCRLFTDVLLLTVYKVGCWSGESGTRPYRFARVLSFPSCSPFEVHGLEISFVQM